MEQLGSSLKIKNIFAKSFDASTLKIKPAVEFSFSIGSALRLHAPVYLRVRSGSQVKLRARETECNKIKSEQACN